jgi:methionine-rich copper-binding protein CopC
MTMADDYSSDINTTGLLAPGATLGAQLDIGDSDWFKVHLDAGKPYVFTLSGKAQGLGTIYDLSRIDFTLYDSADTPLAGDFARGDGSGMVRAFAVRPAVSGDYFVAVSGYYGDRNVGGYSLSYVAQQPDDYAMGTDTKGVLSLDQPVRARFDTAGDVDWFKFHAEAGQHYKVSYSTAAGTVLPGITDYLGADGKSLGLNSYPFEPAVSGDYYVASYGRQAGVYELTLKTVVDDYSTNLTTPGQLDAGGQASGVLQYQYDADSFQFTMKAGNVYTLDLIADSGVNPRWLGLTVYDSNNQAVATAITRDQDGNSHVTVRSDQDGVYRLRVSADSYLTTNGHYTLRSTGVLVDDFSDTIAGAAPIEVGAQQAGSIQFAQDQDMFKVDLQAGVAYDFKLLKPTGPNGVVYMSLDLLDAKGNPALISQYGTDKGVQFVPGVSGSYYAKVSGYGGQQTDYTLLTGLSEDDYSATTATSGVLTVGGKAAGALEGAADRDWFAVTLQAGSTYWFTLAGAGEKPLSTSYGTQVRILDAKGTVFASTDVNHSGTFPVLSFVPAARGTYYVEVAATGQYTGTYELKADIGMRDDFGGDPAHATALVVGGTVSGKLEINSDKDVFKLSVVAGQTYGIDMVAPAGGLSWDYGTRLEIRDDQQGYVSQRSPYNPSKNISTLFQATKTGDYYFTVSGSGGNGDGKPHGYALTTTSYGLDDLSSRTSSVMLPINSQLQAAINHPDDSDAVKVHLEAGRTYVFEMLGSKTGGGSLDTSAYGYGLALYGQSGQIATQDYAPGTQPRLTYTATSTGDYQLEAHGDGRTLGSYTFIATQTTGDVTAPQLLSASPADGSSGLSPTGKIVLTFSETVVLEPNSTFMLSGGATPIRLEAGRAITAIGHTVVIDPNGYLQPGISYKLDMPSGGIFDLAGNKYVGAGSYSFSTVATVATGTDDNDYLLGKNNGQRLDGGKGVDTVYYDDSKNSFSVTRGDGGTFLVKSWPGAGDTLTGIERLIFPNHALALDIDGHGGQAYRLYQAAFNRTPDSAGLGFWMSAMDKGQDLQAVARNFVGSPEFIGAYGAKTSDADFVNLLYHNVLHRDGDAGGAAFWLQALRDGVPRESLLVSFSESPENQAALIGKIGNGFEYTPYG